MAHYIENKIYYFRILSITESNIFQCVKLYDNNHIKININSYSYSGFYYNVLSSQITSSSSESAAGLETRNTELKDLIAEASIRKRQLEEEISSHSKKLETYKRQRNQVSQASEAISRLTEKDTFVDKCIKLIKAIDEYNKQQSLLEINANINDAYSALSEDALRERKLYVVQFDKKRKYMLISYYELLCLNRMILVIIL